ncbi:hypothetical protein ACT7C6_08345 [Bacillus paranthracis]
MLDKEIFVEVPDEETGEIKQYLLTPVKRKKFTRGIKAMFQEGLTHSCKT